jgi:hypothetical protein
VLSLTKPDFQCRKEVEQFAQRERKIEQYRRKREEREREERERKESKEREKREKVDHVAERFERTGRAQLRLVLEARFPPGTEVWHLGSGLRGVVTGIDSDCCVELERMFPDGMTKRMSDYEADLSLTDDPEIQRAREEYEPRWREEEEEERERAERERREREEEESCPSSH